MRRGLPAPPSDREPSDGEDAHWCGGPEGLVTHFFLGGAILRVRAAGRCACCLSSATFGPWPLALGPWLLAVDLPLPLPLSLPLSLPGHAGGRRRSEEEHTHRLQQQRSAAQAVVEKGPRDESTILAVVGQPVGTNRRRLVRWLAGCAQSWRFRAGLAFERRQLPQPHNPPNLPASGLDCKKRGPPENRTDGSEVRNSQNSHSRVSLPVITRAKSPARPVERSSWRRLLFLLLLSAAPALDVVEPGEC